MYVLDDFGPLEACTSDDPFLRSKRDNTFGSVRLSICLCTLSCFVGLEYEFCGAEWSIYGLSLPSAKENHHDTWNTAQDLCLFVSNQETFVIKSCAHRSGAFNL